MLEQAVLVSSEGCAAERLKGCYVGVQTKVAESADGTRIDP